jgi:hypothetical protein
MGTSDPIRDLGERLGRTTNQFAPGTALYANVIERARAMMHDAHTRDDVQRTLTFLDQNLRTHLGDGPRQEFVSCKEAVENDPGPLSVDAFKEGFARGTGEQLPEPADS